MTLGGFLDQFKAKLRAGSLPEDGCVLCGSTARLLHPVENAWACSDCHDPRPVRDECDHHLL